MSPRVFVPRAELEQARNPVQISALLDKFHRLAQVSHLFNENPVSRAGEFEMNELAESIGKSIIGRQVSIEERKIHRNPEVKPIQSFWELSDLDMNFRDKLLQRREGNIRINPADNLEYTWKEATNRYCKVKGTIEAVDGPFASIVVRPVGFLVPQDERCWVYPIEKNGTALVDLKFK